MMQLKRWILAAVLAATLAGCVAETQPGPRAIDGLFPPSVELPALPFRVVDQVGLIRAVRVAGHDGVQEGVSQVPGREDALYVLWVGGACDRRALVVFEHGAEGPTITISTEREFGGCRLVGISRTLMIEFTEPVDASTVSFTMRD